MKLIAAPKWIKENLKVDISYCVLATAHRNRDLTTHKFGHRTVDVSEAALRAYVKRHERPAV